jgi:ABC-type transport system involved in multi-copper enzyme maturation permease subunit
LIFSICFFFSGIICSEYSEKTGYIVFPKINKFKLIIGKYLGNLTLNISVIAFYYFLTALTTMYFYGLPIYVKLFQSFAIAVLYILAVSAFVTFFSSFMKSVNLTIVATILLLLIGFSIVDQIVTLVAPDFEPLYSLSFNSNLITSVITKDFPDSRSERYIDFEVQGFKFRQWITPSIVGGITILLLYMVICIFLASYIFKKRQL